MECHKVQPLSTPPSLDDRYSVAIALSGLSADLRHSYQVQKVEAGYVVIETGNQQLKNAVGVLRDGITFYTEDNALLTLLEEHGLKAEPDPMKNDGSVHNAYRYQIPHVLAKTITDYRPLFLTMLHDSIAYVRNQGK